MYFGSFPLMLYTLDDRRSGQVVTDLARRAGYNKEFINNIAFYEFYDVKDGESPEIVSDIFYNTPLYHWVILHANNIIDPRYDWPMSQENLLRFCIRKYGGEPEIYKTKLYTNQKNYVVDSYSGLQENSPRSDKEEVFISFEDGSTLLLTDPPFTIYSVSRLEYETAINEAKRKIKIPKSEVVSEIVNTFSKLINE